MFSNEVDRLKQVSELASAIRQKYQNLKKEQQYQTSQERSFQPILKKADEILKNRREEEEDKETEKIKIN